MGTTLRTIHCYNMLRYLTVCHNVVTGATLAIRTLVQASIWRCASCFKESECLLAFILQLPLPFLGQQQSHLCWTPRCVYLCRLLQTAPWATATRWRKGYARCGHWPPVHWRTRRMTEWATRTSTWTTYRSSRRKAMPRTRWFGRSASHGTTCKWPETSCTSLPARTSKVGGCHASNEQRTHARCVSGMMARVTPRCADRCDCADLAESGRGWCWCSNMSLTQEQAKGSRHCVGVEGAEFFSSSRDIFLFFQNSTSLVSVTAGASTRVRAACHCTLQLRGFSWSRLRVSHGPAP